METHIYAIRDRLLDYFMEPFVAPGDKQVMSAIAEAINKEGNPHAISKTPHHFEIWVLAKITEEGNVAAGKALVCDCSGLVRPSIRRTEETGPREGAGNPPTGRRQASPAVHRGDPDSQDSPAPHPAPTEARTAS